MNKLVDELLYKEMSRKEFLSTIGIGVVSILGFSGLVKMLSSQKQQKQHRTQSSGYGSTSYGV